MRIPSAKREERLEVRNCLERRTDGQMANDVRMGLSSIQKSLPSKYFYDAHGSKLFEEICHLPEYYLTRTEMRILRAKAGELTRDLQQGDIVELGSGANWKIRTLLDSMEQLKRAGTRYVPVDVSQTALVKAAKELLKIYPELSVSGIVADFTSDLHRLPHDRPKLVLFLGSTIGNLDNIESAAFLSQVASMLDLGDRFVLGMDLVKAKDVLEAAYNDSQNVTEEFNKNVLHVVNRQFSGNFDPEEFDHVAFYNEEKERIEMHLRANKAVTVHIQDLT
jgi:L-histidine Nalpha-methyltransferase